ncbi:MAG: ROK family protein [Synergistaceae bacterium]|nr:ROK family protein [Synergistota bacterium]NLM71785.1 ROK family protein [Synergistaceae bacterium]
MHFVGVDIGGTKCAASLGEASGGELRVLHRAVPRRTAGRAPKEMLGGLLEDVRECLARLPGGASASGIGISCGGPLDSRKGLILSPPNLPGWDRVDAVGWFGRGTGLPAWLCNDADAGALAEWRYGAGRGCRDMVFITCGTGFGAGLILNGGLYEGSSGAAGEIGHVRAEMHGPTGYGKIGSYEGFCSGGGIAQIARTLALREIQTGRPPSFCRTPHELEGITAESVAGAAYEGDRVAVEVFSLSGEVLGRALAVLIDLFNPERIVIGGVFARCRDLLWPAAERAIKLEALPGSAAACEVLPAELSESIGDMAALAVAEYRSSKGGGER